ncbi:MAG: response regulator transcription factor [Anaerolineales bacterium]|nr:response regulator transcription factor [Anaerolineales bacterium]MCB9111618.1 response regulator transcription factor [Anaerolineales bacterium]
MARKILLIDDDPDLGRLVDVILRPMDLTVYQSYSGPDGLKKSYEIHPDLVILDIMMPGLSGFDVCTRLREMSSVPVLMLTARTNENDMLHGFSVGVDDFVKKPFNKNEFEARVRALLRRSNDRNKGPVPYILSYEDPILKIDLSSQTVKLDGEIVELSPREYSVLAYLVREQGKIVSKTELAREVWGEPVSCGLANPSLYVFYIRKKLRDGSYGHNYIHTLWGRGYWFEPRKEE